jgi:excisionase family DNA binding protein
MSSEPNENLVVHRPLTKKETAAYFSVSERTIDRWLVDGSLPQNIKIVVGGSVRFRIQLLQKHLDDLADGSASAQ